MSKVRTTSGPPPALFKEQYEAVGTDGSPVLAKTVGKFFSSTYKAANLAKEMVPEAEVTVLGSDSNSVKLGFQVLAAARAANSGKDLNEILSILEPLKNAYGVVFAIPYIKYLRKGGRINYIQYFFATTLNLRQILEIKNVPIKADERVRNYKNLIPRLMDIISERLRKKRPLRMAVVLVDSESQAWELAKKFVSASPLKNCSPRSLLLS